MSENKSDYIYDGHIDLDVSQIPQLDGNDSGDDARDNLIVGAVTKTVDIRRRAAKFELNQRKQTAGIYRDAQIEDFKLVHKDHDKNINIECNSGFYVQVAKPTVSSLSHDPVPPALGFSIVCDSMTQNHDALGLEFNLTIFLRIVHDNGNSNKVTIHTHNSTRCIQVQGGSSMPDRSTSALWFVKNVLYDKFQSLAKARSYNIASINQAITAAGNPSGLAPSKKCGLCDRNLDARSFPINCQLCKKWFHKTSCYKAHRCMNTSYQTQTVSTTASSIFGSSSSSSPAIQSLPSSASSSINTSTNPTSTTTTCFSITTTSSTPSSSTPMSTSTLTSTSQSLASRSLIITVPSSNISTRASTSDISPPASLNVNAPLFLPPPPLTKKTRQTQNPSSFTPERAEIESLKIELSFARTKIADLTTKNKDNEQTINIYSQKIKLLEQNRREFVQQKYFSAADSSSKPSSDMSLTLDCDCKIRAQITKNTLNINDISQKLCHEASLGSRTSPPSLVTSSDASKAAVDSNNQKTDTDPVLVLTQPDGHDRHDEKDDHSHVEPKDVTVNLTNDKGPESDHESDFDFSESFERPVDSPKIDLN